MTETIEWIACADRLPEEFRPVVGWEGLYEVSSLGRVRSLPRRVIRHDGTEQNFKGKVMALTDSPHGYKTVRLSDAGRRARPFVHRLVCDAFIENPFGFPHVNHKNAVRHDNRVENLEWVTPLMNIRHAMAIGTFTKEHIPIRRGEASEKAKLREHDVSEVRALQMAGLSSRKVASIYGIGKSQVLRIWSGQAWQHMLPGGPKG